MGMIRGKLESPCELHPRRITVGDPPFVERDGKWFDKKTGSECVVEILEEAYEGGDMKDELPEGAVFGHGLGDGSDGDLTIGAYTTFKLTRHMQVENLTVLPGGSISFNGFTMRVRRMLHRHPSNYKTWVYYNLLYPVASRYWLWRYPSAEKES